MQGPVDPQEKLSLHDILQTSLEVAVRVQMSGGYTSRVVDTTEVVARSLGAERVEASVSSAVIGVTVHRGGSSATGIQRTPHIGINFAELSALSELTKRAPSMNPAEIREHLGSIASTSKRYPVPAVLLALGVSCASFAALFGADWKGAVAAGLGGLAGAFVRYRLVKAHFKPFLFCLLAALTSTVVVLALARWTSDPTPALSACVLYLVPGVPLLNGFSDLLATHYLNGLVRLTMAAVMVLGAATGIAAALGLFGWLS